MALPRAAPKIDIPQVRRIVLFLAAMRGDEGRNQIPEVASSGCSGRTKERESGSTGMSPH